MLPFKLTDGSRSTPVSYGVPPLSGISYVLSKKVKKKTSFSKKKRYVKHSPTVKRFQTRTVFPYLFGTGAPFSSNSFIAHQPQATSLLSPVDYKKKWNIHKEQGNESNWRNMTHRQQGEKTNTGWDFDLSFPQRQSTLINLPLSWASQVFGRKSDCEWSRSIAQWTMGTLSAGAKEAGIPFTEQKSLTSLPNYESARTG